MAQKNTGVMRADESFEKIVKQVMAKNLLRGKYIKTPRVTRAVANQYKKYPYLLKELEEADLR